MRLGYRGRQRRRGRLLIEPHKQLLVGLNNDSNKLKKYPKTVRGIASRLLLKQLQKRELLLRLRIVERLQVLQQAHHHYNHDTAEPSISQLDLDSYILYSGLDSLTFN
jgi:hypothetical protein